MSWTEERIEELRKLWGEGLSASQIANTLGGVSRNAVIGKIHRLGLSGRVKTPRSPARRAPAAVRPAKPKTQPRVMAVGSTVVKVVEREAPALEPVAEPRVAEVVPLHGGVSLLELSPCTCRWPIGDPAEESFRFCGAKTSPTETYCSSCADIAFPGRARARAARQAAEERRAARA